MEQESSGELSYVECHLLYCISISIVFPSEGHFSFRERDQSLIGDSNSMGVTRQVLQHLQWSAKRWLGVNHPLELAQLVQETRKVISFFQMFGLPVKHQATLLVCIFQISNKLPAEQRTEDLDWEKESFPATDPPRMVRRESSPRYDTMQMWMVTEGLTPGMQHCQKTDYSTQMLWVSGYLQQSLRSGLKKQSVNHPLVLKG